MAVIVEWDSFLNFVSMEFCIKRNTHLLQTSKSMLNMQTKKVLYFAQIYSHLSYGIITWGNMINVGQKCKLEKLTEIAVN